MKEVTLTIVRNEKVSSDIYLMELSGDLSEIKSPGEFVEVKIPNYYLRRPISVHRYSKNSLELLYKVLGHGTKDMTTYPLGMKLDCLVGLGNGFDVTKAKKPLLVAGGIGIAPLIALAEKFNEKDIQPIILFGSATSDGLVMVDELSKLGKVILCTDDGSLGYKGNPVSYLKENKVDFDYYYACGPQVMLKYLKEFSDKGELSLEARMGCGFGACMGCSIETVNGPKRVCKEGPVFASSEVLL